MSEIGKVYNGHLFFYHFVHILSNLVYGRKSALKI